jgi:broad specificity phosphatase PhoE
MRITFVRHGETPDNASKIWQGHDGGGLSEKGQAQAAALGGRLAGRNFTRILSSDVLRVVETSSFLEKQVELDSRFREIHVGSWAGRSIPETYKESPEVFSGMQDGSDVRLGGDGESVFEFRERVAESVTQLVSELDHNDDVLVLSHGGFIGNVIAGLFGYAWPSTPTTLAQNTSMSVLEFESDGLGRLQVFNDAAHLGEIEVPKFHGEGPVLTLVRHGQTDANREERWLGQTCEGLNQWGEQQAGDLAKWMAAPEQLHSSDTLRAVATASAFGIESLSEHEGLREIHLGEWEGATTPEVMSGWPDVWKQIYHDRLDVPRGATGDTWESLTKRVQATVDHIAGHGHDATLVSHGSAIRSYVVGVLGGGWDESPRLGFMRNTAVARIHIGQDRPRLIDYGVAPHLEPHWDHPIL